MCMYILLLNMKGNYYFIKSINYDMRKKSCKIHVRICDWKLITINTEAQDHAQEQWQAEKPQEISVDRAPRITSLRLSKENGKTFVPGEKPTDS